MKNPISNILLLFGILLLEINLVSAGSNLRIIGGKEAKLQDHPWMVSLANPSKQHICGGSLINDDTIVTAAHCFINNNILFAIFFGVHNPKRPKIFMGIEKPKLHEKFDPARSFDYDIAIVKMIDKVVWPTRVSPIRLPKQDTEVPSETSVITAGWGLTEQAENSDGLLEVNIKTMDSRICKERLSHGDKFTERMICAGDLNGKVGVCQGDQGGPLELNGTLVGIASWVDDCGKPAAYTKVASFVSWINKNIDLCNEKVDHLTKEATLVGIEYELPKWDLVSARQKHLKGVLGKGEKQSYAVVGVSDLRQEKNFLSFKKPKLHEKYDSLRSKSDNDIAIVKLAQKVVFSSKVQPIRLPKPDIYVPTGTSVITAGWGYTVAGASRGSDVLMEVKINIIDWKICNMLYKAKLTERVICAGDLNGGVDSCHGDSGGPLELNGTLIGVVSSGGICGAPFSPGIYTKVSDFVSWINKNIDI
ncbi:transmembrane protease serine 9-like [Diabrotica undecimpunctata]|uniref:transmembrane protease serine 9-like n=1 Tax=Diabrotica undecimpunctata TaxID=50387 RepID=UPI003B63A7BB